MRRSSLDAAYFDDIFSGDDDPWDLASSPYEAAKFDHTHNVLTGRRYAEALEVGCAHGVLTARLAPLCDNLLAIDISTQALAKANKRIGDRPGVVLQKMAFPKETPDKGSFDLIILSEVAYYWDVVDLDRASEWLRDHVRPAGRLLLVHYIGETDYPQTGDAATDAIWSELQDVFQVKQAERCDGYRLDLWTRI